MEAARGLTRPSGSLTPLHANIESPPTIEPGPRSARFGAAGLTWGLADSLPRQAASPPFLPHGSFPFSRTFAVNLSGFLKSRFCGKSLDIEGS